MSVIRNREQLIKNGCGVLDRKARRIALQSVEAALSSVDPIKIVKSKLFLKDSVLKVGTCSFDLDKFKNIYVIGGGKASGSMAEALEQVLGKRITCGLVNVLHGDKHETKAVQLHEASHPVPDEAGVKGVRKMLKIADEATKDDLIICLLSGGGSSLMPLPRGDVSLVDKRQMTDALLKSGATINEINTLRKHISDFKGGWLAKKAFPATVLNLILSDVLGDPLDFIASGPTVPDSTTFNDAVAVLKKYGLWEKAPASIVKVLSEGVKGSISETPKTGDKVFKKVHNIVIGNNRSASLAAKEELDKGHVNGLLLTAMLEGEARHVGTVLASIAREVRISGNPVTTPAGVVAGGETTVTVTGKGRGGRNQEIALAAAMKLQGSNALALVSFSTDGIDGPTDAAGAIVDGSTISRALDKGLSPSDFLARNDSYSFFKELGDLVFTGSTGTNVNDVCVVVVL